MPVIITPTPDPATTRPAQDPQWVVQPWSIRSSDQACLERSREDEAVLNWQALVDAGQIGGNPPAPPEVVAQREANDALFRSLARSHVRVRSRA